MKKARARKNLYLATKKKTNIKNRFSSILKGRDDCISDIKAVEAEQEKSSRKWNLGWRGADSFCIESASKPTRNGLNGNKLYVKTNFKSNHKAKSSMIEPELKMTDS